MTIDKLSKYLERLDNTPKRLEITAILKELIQETDPEESDIAVYLSLGYLIAKYETPKFNIAEKMMLKVLENTYNAPIEQINSIYQKSGDLGNVAFELSKEGKSSAMKLPELHKILMEIAHTEGTGSQEKKIQKTTELLQKVDRLSAKYLVRIILGTTRLGFTELTIIEALNSLVGGDKETKSQIETAYNVHPDIGKIAKVIKKDGLKGIKHIGMEVGVPFLPQKCQRLTDPVEIIDKMECVYVEYKFDGTRVQLHMDRNKEVTSTSSEQKDLFSDNKGEIFVKTFTRNLEETTTQYPEIIDAALEQIEADSVILDGEAVGYNRETGEFLPFQDIMQRKRKHGIEKMAEQIPLKFFVFDILYKNGEELISKPLNERREILNQTIKKGPVIEVDVNLKTSDPEELYEFFERSKEKGLEGLVVKKVDAQYQAGARSYSWIKYKKADSKLLNDTIDCVILGYYYGKGVRADFGIGGFLAGIYDKATDGYKTLTKVGTGLKDEDFKKLKVMADKIKTSKKPSNVDLSDKFKPDVWVTPKIVVELGTDEITKSKDHSAGYALRFPRLINFRGDKSPQDTTQLDEIVEMHNAQKRGNY